MKIVDVRATVAVPLEAPLRHANGAHWGRFVRTIVEVETDDGLIGLGEMGGGGESAENSVRALKPYLLGHDPLHTPQSNLRAWIWWANAWESEPVICLAAHCARRSPSRVTFFIAISMRRPA